MNLEKQKENFKNHRAIFKAYDWTIEYPNHDKKKYLEYQEKLKQLVMDYLKEIGMEPGFFSGH